MKLISLIQNSSNVSLLYIQNVSMMMILCSNVNDRIEAGLRYFLESSLTLLLQINVTNLNALKQD